MFLLLLKKSLMNVIKMNSTKLLLKLECRKLPINIFEIVKKSNISLIPYSTLCKSKSLKKSVIYNISYDGFSTKYNDKYTIFYNDEIKNKGRINWTLAHELIHIYSGHLEKDFISSFSKLDKYVDYQTVKFLCPVIILKECDISSPKEIQKLCNVSSSVSLNAYQRYLSKKNYKFYQFSEEEQKLAKRFFDFTESYNNFKKVYDVYF